MPARAACFPINGTNMVPGLAFRTKVPISLRTAAAQTLVSGYLPASDDL